MPLVVSAPHPDDTEVLLISGGVRNDEDAYKLQRAVKLVDRVIAVGTCAISGGVTNLGDRDDVRKYSSRRRSARTFRNCSAKPTPWTPMWTWTLLAGLSAHAGTLYGRAVEPWGFKAASIVCAECGRRKLNDETGPHHWFPKGDLDPDICLVNQGFLCVGTSARAAGAPCTRAGHPAWAAADRPTPSSRESGVWMENIQRVFERMTNIPSEELNEALRSPQLSMFLFQFSDYAGGNRRIRSKDKVL